METTEGSPRGGTTEKPTGIAAAATLAAAIGPLTLAASHLLAEVTPAGKAWVHAWGKAWMPGAEGIGPYAGKETLALVAWLGAWLWLHLVLRRRAVNLTVSGALFLLGLGIATTLLWPPITERVVHLLGGGH